MRKIALLVPAVLVLAACGSGGGSSSSQSTMVKATPVAYVKGAAHKTAQAPSEHVDLQANATVGGASIQVNGQGDFDNTKKLGSLHADFSSGALSGAIDAVLNGATLYLKSPLLSSALPQGKQWFKLDLQKVAQSKGIDFSSLTSQRPDQWLAQLQGAGKVTTVGDETIDGSATTHYRVKIDLDKLPQAAKIAALPHARYAPVDIWIGQDDGYVHRMRLAYSRAAGGPRQSIAMTINFSDFGETVSVAVPSDSETFDTTGAAIKGLGS